MQYYNEAISYWIKYFQKKSDYIVKKLERSWSVKNK